MAFRGVSVVQVKELLRRWLTGEGERPVANGVGVARTTARGYIAAAVELGLDRSGGVDLHRLLQPPPVRVRLGPCKGRR